MSDCSEGRQSLSGNYPEGCGKERKVTIENTSTDFCVEKHYKPDELAEILNYSVDTIYREFRNEPGVIEVGSDEKMHKRKKKSIRIPHSVYVR